MRVAVVCGGTSSERKISLRSGRAVYQALKRAGLTAVYLDPSKSSFSLKLLSIDVAFLALHGKGGEDGTIQRVLEKRKIPYIGSNSVSSQAAFNKVSAKKVFIRSDIPTAPYTLIRIGDWQTRLKSVQGPLFLKPPLEGSSIGAFPVEDLRESAVKIKQTLRRFGSLIAERKIEGREFTVGILGNRALPVIELRPKAKFYDYHSKYTKGMTDYLVPAPIDKLLAKKLQRIALNAHRALKLRDLSRVDIMVDEQSQPFVLEANSLPGFTELSLLPKAAQAAGISFEELCCRLVQMAWRRRKNG